MATSSSTARNNSDILQYFIDTLEVVCQQLKDNTNCNRRAEDFDEETFWKTIDASKNLISHEATKMCMMFSKPPVPPVEECHSLVNGMESSCVALLSGYFKLPLSMGETLHKDIYLCVLSIFQAVKELCFEAKNQSSAGQLKSVGNVWEKCKLLEKAPKNNKDAVLMLFRDQLSTVKDALEELQQNMDDENAFDEELNTVNGFLLHQSTSWSAEDRQLLASCLGLIKTAKACMKKCINAINIRGNSSSVETASELDNVANLAKSISALVDDFVLSLYPPMSCTAIKDNATNLKEHLLKLLNEISSIHCSNNDDRSWIDFLQRATDHNFNNICTRIPN